MTAIDRLRLLLPWLNTPSGYADAQQAIERFIASFDGSEDAGFVVAENDVEREYEGESLLESSLPGNELDGDEGEEGERLAELYDISGVLLSVLHEGTRDEGGDGRLYRRAGYGEDPDFESLSFRFVRGVVADRPVKPTRKELADWSRQRIGHLVVRGALRDLLPYLLLRVVASPDMTRLRRCIAPLKARPEQCCGRFFIEERGQRGRPREICSPYCQRVVAKRRKAQDAERERLSRPDGPRRRVVR